MGWMEQEEWCVYSVYDVLSKLRPLWGCGYYVSCVMLCLIDDRDFTFFFTFTKISTGFNYKRMAHKLHYLDIQTIGLLEEKITKAGQCTSLHCFIVFLQSAWGKTKRLYNTLQCWENIRGVYMQNSHSGLKERKKPCYLLHIIIHNTHTFPLTGSI
jgi:hypothetical protein